MVYKLARELYPRMSLALSRLPASQFSGLSGAESDMRAMIAWHTDCNVHAGLHAVFKISRQISPVCKQALIILQYCLSAALHATHKQTEQPAMSYLEVDIWMENLCFESHIGSYQRILFRNFQDNLKYTTLKRSFFGSLQTVTRQRLLPVVFHWHN